MLKQDLLTLIEKFIKETWKYNESDELDNDMEYVYRIESELKNNESVDLKQIYNKLLSVIGTIRFKYGFESTIINTNSDLKEKISKIDLKDENLATEYTIIEEMYSDYVKNISNVDFLNIQRNSSNEGLYLALESLKSLITNSEYRELLKDEQIEEVLVDCIKLINGVTPLQKIETKYKELIQEIWKKTLSNSTDKSSFRLLYSNITGPLLEQATNLINRQNQSSCSMIGSNLIATYLGKYRRIGFIYPNDSNIIMASAYDLGSNVFGSGVKNREKGTSLVTPVVLERIGIERAKANGEEPLSSSCYNEVLVDSRPCGITIIGFGEDDINIDYEDAVKLASELHLPLHKTDIMDYKEKLSEVDKEYIAYHCILSYMGINSETMNYLSQNNEAKEIFELIDKYKESIAQKFIELKKLGTLNKKNMLQALSEIMDISKNTSIKR